MREVAPGIFIDGTLNKVCLYPEVNDDTAVIHAAKDPCHRKRLGYTTRGAPKGHPHEHLLREGRHLILNMVDAPEPKYFLPLMFHQARDFAAERRAPQRFLRRGPRRLHRPGPALRAQRRRSFVLGDPLGGGLWCLRRGQRRDDVDSAAEDDRPPRHGPA